MPRMGQPSSARGSRLAPQRIPSAIAQKRNTKSIGFHRSTETHDRQRANHTQRQYHIACDTTDDQCGYHQNRHKGNIKAAAIQHTAVGFLIYIEDKQPDYERCPKAKRRIQKGKATEAIQKAALKNVIKCH